MNQKAGTNSLQINWLLDIQTLLASLLHRNSLTHYLALNLLVSKKAKAVKLRGVPRDNLDKWYQSDRLLLR